MNTSFYNVSQDFIISEMMKKQTNQVMINCEFQNWEKSERNCNYDRSVRCENHLSKGAKIEQFKKQLIIKSKPVRMNIAKGLVFLAGRIAAMEEDKNMKQA